MTSINISSTNHDHDLNHEDLNCKNLDGANLECEELDQLIQQVREDHQQLLDLLKNLEALRQAKKHPPALIFAFRYLRDQYQSVRKVISTLYGEKPDTSKKVSNSSRVPSIVGMISGPPDMSVRYKEVVHEQIEKKFQERKRRRSCS
ncbi:MAG: hypothetical protein AAF889_01770 [Cyanobacteria bacterium P01_D01_bin.73]